MPTRVSAGHDESGRSARNSSDAGRREKLVEEVFDFASADPRDRNTATLVISGQAGIGKSWIIDHVIAKLLRSPETHLILRARGHFAETEFNFSGLNQLLRPVMAETHELPPAERMALRSALSGASFTSEGSDQIHRVALGTLVLLERLSLGQPVILLVDNAQWLDAPTRRVLTFISHRIAGSSIVMVIATRDGSLHSHLECHHVELGLLDDEEARGLVRQIAPDLSAAAIEHVVASAGGMPLALVEIPQLPDLQSRLEITDNFLPGDVLDLLPPGTTLLEAYRERISWMSTTELRAAITIALDDLNLSQITQVFDEIGAELSDLVAAEHAGLIEWHHGVPRIAHSTVRGALHELVPGSEQIVVRQAILSVLENDPGRAARHLVVLLENTVPEVADTLARAAREAQERGEHVEAGRLWELAARRTQPDDFEKKKERLNAAVDANIIAGSEIAATRCVHALWKLATESEDRALEVTAHTRWLEVNYGVGEPLTWLPEAIRGRSVDAVTPLLDVAAIAATEAPTEVAYMLTFLMNVLRSRARYEDAVSVAQAFQAHVPSGARILEAELLIENIERGKGKARSDDLMFSSWIEILSDDALIRFVYLADSLLLTMIWGDVPGINDLVQRFSELVARRHLDAFASKANFWLAVVFQRDGHWQEALEFYGRAEQELLTTDFRGFETSILLPHAWLTAQQGDIAATEALISRAEKSTRIKPPGFIAVTEAIMGMLAFSNGRCEAALARFMKSQASHKYLGFAHPVVPAVLVAEIESLWRMRRDGEARKYLELFQKRAALKGSFRHRALADRCQGLFAEEFEKHFERATENHERCRQMRGSSDKLDFDLARTYLLWGMRLRRLRRKHDAGRRLHQALQVFDAIGADTWANLTRSELKACGERHIEVAGVPDHLKNLTPREFEIAAEAALGLTNVEIAAKLNISPRTVEQHLGAVFQKLGISRRTELAGIMPKPG